MDARFEIVYSILSFFFFSKATDFRLCRWSLTRRINTSRPITRWIQDDNGDIVGTVSREWVSRSSHVRRFSIFLLFFSPFEFPTRSRYLRYALLFHPSSLLSLVFFFSPILPPFSLLRMKFRTRSRLWNVRAVHRAGREMKISLWYIVSVAFNHIRVMRISFSPSLHPRIISRSMCILFPARATSHEKD